MAWVSTCGGLALANAGLGAVHGFAGVIGGLTHAPHGEICGVLLPSVLESHARKAKSGTDIDTRLQWVLGQIDSHFAQENKGDGLSGLRRWSKEMGLRDLETMGLTLADYPHVAKVSQGTSSMKGTPFSLTQQELLQILESSSFRV